MPPRNRKIVVILTIKLFFALCSRLFYRSALIGVDHLAISAIRVIASGDLQAKALSFLRLCSKSTFAELLFALTSNSEMLLPASSVKSLIAPVIIFIAKLCEKALDLQKCIEFDAQTSSYKVSQKVKLTMRRLRIK